MTAPDRQLLAVDGLTVQLRTEQGPIRPVDAVSLSLEKGKTLALVGESGSGKSMLCRAILGLVPAWGHIRFDGRDTELNRLRGRDIGVVLQNPLSSLNPVMTIADQIIEPMAIHLGIPRRERLERALALLRSVGIPAPGERLGCYPHQLSGGMRQRVAIAMALACDPQLLIADEPTTALDVTVQAEILDLLGRLQQERNMAMILVTHDLGVVAGHAHDVAVMYAGRIVEQAPTRELFDRMRMPYTRALFQCVPRLDDPPNRVLPAIEGHPPNLAALPPGCRFAPRCIRAQGRCRTEEPPLVENGRRDHRYACWFPCGEGEATS